MTLMTRVTTTATVKPTTTVTGNAIGKATATIATATLKATIHTMRRSRNHKLTEMNGCIINNISHHQDE